MFQGGFWTPLTRLLGRRITFPQTLGPAFLNRNRRAFERQSVGRHIGRDHRARPDIGAIPHLDRRNQRRVRTDEGVLADIGTVFGGAVVIAGDGAGTDVGALADPGVADIGEMIGLVAMPAES